MSVVTFDTLKFVKTLEAAGVPPQQAEAFSAAVRDAHDAADLATKADLNHEISDLRKDMNAKFESLEQRMTIKLGSMLVVAIGVVAAVVKLL